MDKDNHFKQTGDILLRSHFFKQKVGKWGTRLSLLSCFREERPLGFRLGVEGKSLTKEVGLDLEGTS